MPDKQDHSEMRLRVCMMVPIGYGKPVVADVLARVAAERSRTLVKFDSDVAVADVAILVVSAADGPSPDARAELLLARQANVPHLVVALDEVDKVNDPELLDLVELEVRELVRQCGYLSDLPLVHLSALKALQGNARSVASVVKLLNTLEQYVQVPG